MDCTYVYVQRINRLISHFISSECVANADETLGEMFLEEKTPNEDDIKVCIIVYRDTYWMRFVFVSEIPDALSFGGVSDRYVLLLLIYSNMSITVTRISNGFCYYCNDMEGI